MPFPSLTKLVSLPAACPDLLRPAPVGFRVKSRLPKDLPFVIGALLAAGVVVTFVLALHSA